MNRALASIAVLVALTAITSCDHSPTSPGGGEVVGLAAQLLAVNEVTPVASTEANGTGTATA